MAQRGYIVLKAGQEMAERQKRYESTALVNDFGWKWVQFDRARHGGAGVEGAEADIDELLGVDGTVIVTAIRDGRRDGHLWPK